MLLISFAYFHQGGGWNQNSRFDQVRAIVESGRLEINDYLIYRPQRTPDGRMHFRRELPPTGLTNHVELPESNSGDTAVYRGRVYPNKPPGVVLMAVPAYWAVHSIERVLGIDPDDYAAMTWNLFLTTALTLAPLGAWAGVLLFRLSRRMFPAVPMSAHVATALTFGLGTLTWPFSTMLFDHVPTAAFALASFLLLAPTAQTPSRPPSPARVIAAGLLAGWLVMLNYTAVLMLVGLAVYVARRWRSARATLTFALAAAPPIALLALYHHACFGSIAATANTYQLATFSENERLWLGMFGAPDPLVALKLLFWPHWGLVSTSPVMILGLWGAWNMRRDAARGVHLGWGGTVKRTRLAVVFSRSDTGSPAFTANGVPLTVPPPKTFTPARRPEANFIAAIFLLYLAMNASFNGWHGGYSFGPRYLLPTVPFLCVALTPMFARIPRIAAGFAGLSIAITLLATAVNPLVPINIDAALSDYLVPLAAGREVDLYGVRFEPPVSCNPRGPCEWGFPMPMFPPGSPESRWNAFNLGELIWPQSRMSLLPLLIVLGVGGYALKRHSATPPRIRTHHASGGRRR